MHGRQPRSSLAETSAGSVPRKSRMLVPAIRSWARYLRDPSWKKVRRLRVSMTTPASGRTIRTLVWFAAVLRRDKRRSDSNSTLQVPAVRYWLLAENTNGIVTQAVVWVEASAPQKSRLLGRERINLLRLAARSVRVVLVLSLLRRGTLGMFRTLRAPDFAPCTGGNFAISCSFANG
jgi:hypothetical protein